MPPFLHERPRCLPLVPTFGRKPEGSLPGTVCGFFLEEGRGVSTDECTQTSPPAHSHAHKQQPKQDCPRRRPRRRKNGTTARFGAFLFHFFSLSPLSRTGSTTKTELKTRPPKKKTEQKTTISTFHVHKQAIGTQKSREKKTVTRSTKPEKKNEETTDKQWGKKMGEGRTTWPPSRGNQNKTQQNKTKQTDKPDKYEREERGKRRKCKEEEERGAARCGWMREHKMGENMTHRNEGQIPQRAALRDGPTPVGTSHNSATRLQI